MPERTDDFVPGDDIELARNDDERSEADNAAELRAEIRETRERMGDSLEQLGERLNPGNIKDRVKQDIRDATIGKVENMAHSAADQLDEARQTIGDAQRTVVDVVRDNPIPAAMVGIGLGWIAYNVRQRGSRGSLGYGRSSLAATTTEDTLAATTVPATRGVARTPAKAKVKRARWIARAIRRPSCRARRSRPRASGRIGRRVSPRTWPTRLATRRAGSRISSSRTRLPWARRR